MFYRPGKTAHGLPYDPFKACVVPRPIGWISTASPASADKPSVANLAPYSQFQNLSFDPPYVMFSGNQTHENVSKDSARNAELTGVFCWQMATYDLKEAVNITSEPFEYGVDEFEKAGLTKQMSKVIQPSIPMVEESPVKFECEYYSTIRLPGNLPAGSVDMIVGKVVAVHIKDEYLTNGKLDIKKTMPIARCGYYDYAVIRDTFEMVMPGGELIRACLEGNATKLKEILAKRGKSSHST